MKREISAGGVVYRKEDRKIMILMIKDHTGKWTLPKGLIDKGENPKQTAIREIQEETGIKAEIVEKLDDVKYVYQREGEKIFKIVTFYLMKTKEKKITHQEEEIQDAKWIELQEAKKISGYKNTENILKNSIERIKKIESKKSLKDF